MKTLTEFSGFQLAKVLTTLEALTVGGKTEEEKSAHIAKEYKLEGDKLKLFQQALDVAKGRTQHLKRVVVLTLNEGEKAPENAVEKEGRYFLTEFFYVSQPKRRGRDARKGRRDKRGGKGERSRSKDEKRFSKRAACSGKSVLPGKSIVLGAIGTEKTTADGTKTVIFATEGKEKPQKRRPSRRPRRAPRGPKGTPPANPLKITVSKEGVQMTVKEAQLQQAPTSEEASQQKEKTEVPKTTEITRV